MQGQLGGDSLNVAVEKGINFELPSVVFSGIVAVRDRLLQLPNPLRLESGDPNFDTPDHIKEAAAKAIRDNNTHYAPSTGIKKLRDAIVRKVSQKNRMRLSDDLELWRRSSHPTAQLDLDCLDHSHRRRRPRHRPLAPEA
jgi:hypothetical protein